MGSFEKNLKAIIYCRVSSRQQVNDGHGLESQEHRCRQYCESNNYSVVEVFKDEAISGARKDRPGLERVLEFIYANPLEQFVLVFDDISRLARSLQVHLELVKAIRATKTLIESPSMKFENTTIGRYIEGQMALNAQLFREINTDIVIARQKACVESGNWPFPVPVGYIRIGKGKEKAIIKDEPLASIIKEAIEGYATGRFRTQMDVKRFLESKAEYPKNKKGGVYNQRINTLLNSRFYTGHYKIKGWEMEPVKGNYEPIISIETYEQVQWRLKGKDRLPVKRKSDNELFPLRGLIVCSSCKKALTGSESTSRNGSKHAYYRCLSKKSVCVFGGKSIKNSVLEKQFASLLRLMTPSEKIIDFAKAIITDTWHKRVSDFEHSKRAKRASKDKIKAEIDKLVTRISNATDSSLIEVYERKISELRDKERTIESELVRTSRVDTSFERAFELVLPVISNPHKLWEEGDFKQKQMVSKLVLSKRISYDRDNGFGTAVTTLPFKVFGQLGGKSNEKVELNGIEPLTSTLPV